MAIIELTIQQTAAHTMEKQDANSDFQLPDWQKTRHAISVISTKHKAKRFFSKNNVIK
jgi:hypothetical protein